MKILIPSKGRPLTIRTHKWLEESNLNYSIVLHTESERNEYLKNKTIDSNKLIVSGVTGFLPAQREWMNQCLVNDGEWVLYLDDNIDGFTCAQEDYYNNSMLCQDVKNFNNDKFNKVLSTSITAIQLLVKCGTLRSKCDEEKINLCGFATTDNPLFRNKKFRNYGYVIGKAMIRKKTRISFPVEWYCQEDYYDSAEHILQFGKVLINNFIRPMSRHYEEGGIGNYNSRLPHKIILNKLLMNMYPGLFRYNRKSGCPKEAEIVFRLNTEKQIECWRSWMKFIYPKLQGKANGVS